jgi:hypothetical protein
MRHIFPVVIVCAALLGAPALAQDTPDPLPVAIQAPETPATYTPDPERLPYRHTLRLRDGETRVVTGQVAANDPIISIPVAHRRTAVLMEDMRDSALFANNAVVVPAGSPGYQAGAAGSDFSLRGSDIWCFFPRFAEGNLRVSCFSETAANTNSEAVVTTTSPPANPFAAPVYYMTAYVGTINAPRVEDRPIEFVPDMRLEFSLMRWTRTYAWVAIRINGDRVEERRLRKDDNNSVSYPTPIGRLRLRQISRTNMNAAIASLEPFAAADAEVLNVAREYQTIMGDLQRSLAAPPQPLLRATTEVTPDAAPRAVTPGAIVFSQMVQPGAAMKQDQTPRGRENAWGPPGAPLLAVSRGRSQLLCWRQGTIEGGWWSGVRSHCLQDADGQPGYEVHWTGAPFLAGSSFAMTNLTGRSTMREPVSVSPAPDHQWPSEHLVVRYQGLEGEIRGADGAIRPRAVRFMVQIGRAEPQIENWQPIVLPLDAQGVATLTLGGREVARISNVQADGAAQLQTLAGLPGEPVAVVDETATMENVAARARALRVRMEALRAQQEGEAEGEGEDE